MKEVFDVAWHRFTVITSVVADAQSRFISTLFYFTILVPFGIGSILFTDPLRRKAKGPEWLKRDPVPTDLESAKEQG